MKSGEWRVESEDKISVNQIMIDLNRLLIGSRFCVRVGSAEYRVELSTIR